TVVVSPLSYNKLLTVLAEQGGAVPRQDRIILAQMAFSKIQEYDSAIATYYFERLFAGPPNTQFFYNLHIRGTKAQQLRYGENPHQQAAFYRDHPSPDRPCVATAEQLHGKELSYNNILDLDSALNLAREFAEPAAVVVKHNNPCGAATAPALADAFRLAWDGDPQSAFGGILAFNRPVDAATADALATGQRFVECVIAPDFDPAAFEILTTKPTWKKNVRLLRTGDDHRGLTSPARLEYRSVDGGLLVQTRDTGADDVTKWEVKTQRPPTDAERAALWFAWLVCKHVKSNAIVLASGGRQSPDSPHVVGVGAGQMSRVDSVQIAARKAGDRAKGSVLASDAFFPFPDNVELAAGMGVTAIVQPGGSVKDADSIAACDKHGIAMVFTGVRHFRH
ncbi:MAG: bifunctional phosphoribosylaminoimidazolecarboxamide formyltransferase/IMP cyclohydrolase, partial [Fimbriiglobus sp.]